MWEYLSKSTKGRFLRVLWYIINRLLWTIPVLFVATLLTFALVKALPGEPFDGTQAARLNPQVAENQRKAFGLDKPWHVQYGKFVQNAVQGNLGASTKSTASSVSDVLRDTLPVSATLGALAFLFAVLVGIPIGVISALRANSIVDYLLTGFSTLFFAVPVFVTATLWVGFVDSGGWSTWQERVGPILILGVVLLPYFIRLVRASMLEALQSDYVTTARSKGLPWRVTVARHALRNSLIPVVTNAGPLFGFTITGSFIIEKIMAVPGMANQFIVSFNEPLDQNMVLGTTVLLAIIVVVANLVADLLIGVLDPRISHE